MDRNRPLRLGIMGFGQTGRQLFDLVSGCEDVEVVAIADVGAPDILHYLLRSEVKYPDSYALDGNFLVGPGSRARLMPTDRPSEMPWDIFGVDLVVDATGVFCSAQEMRAHLAGGAPRVLLRTLPTDEIDRIVIPGVNHDSIDAADRLISAGSPTTTALCLLLHILSQRFVIECGSLTTIHAYTSDQALQDYVGVDYRRSRSAARNIIPNGHEAGRWLGQILPPFAGKIQTSALNVPVQEGCMLDVNLVFEDSSVTAEDINQAMREGAAEQPHRVGVVEDPVVSSDVLGSSLSLMFDAQGTLHAGEHFMKTLSWYETRGHAARMLEVIRMYGELDSQAEAA
jgi:glyceraldehyde 3-phosphate dehydrogenase